MPSSSNSVEPYWEAIAAGQETDFAFACDDPRFADVVIEVLTEPLAGSTDESDIAVVDAADYNTVFEPAMAIASADNSRHCSSSGQEPVYAGTQPDLGNGISILDDIKRYEVMTNSLLLASHSLYFRKVLEQEFTRRPRVQLQVHLQRTDLPSFMQLIRWLYIKKLPLQQMAVEDVMRLILLADRFQVPSIIRKTMQFLQRFPLDAASVRGILALPDHLQAISGPVFNLCLQYLERRFEHLDLLRLDEDLRSEFLQLPRMAVAYLLQSTKVSVDCENTVFVLLQHWAKHKGLQPEVFHRPPYLELLHSLRYAFMTPDFINHKVAPARTMQSDIAHRLINEGAVYRTAPMSFRERLIKEADHIRFIERPRPPPHFAKLCDAPSPISARHNSGPGGLLSRFSCAVWGVEGDPPMASSDVPLPSSAVVMTPPPHVARLENGK